MLDYYHMLGVDRLAAASTIKARYQILVLKYHPDRNTSADAARRLMRILEAYQVLSDPDRRKEYDQLQYKQPEQHANSRQNMRRQDAQASGTTGRHQDNRQEEPMNSPSPDQDTLVTCGFCGDDAIYDADMDEVVCYHCGYTGPLDV